MSVHAIFRSDKMWGTDNDAGLVNVKISADCDNGAIMAIGALASGEREAYVATASTSSTALTSACIVAEPEVMYGCEEKMLADFYNKAGSVVRAYRLQNGDEFSLTAAGFAGTPDVGAYVTIGAGKLSAGSSSSGAIGTIIAKEHDFYVVRIQA